MNPVNGDVYVIFASNPPGPDGADVYFSRSTDGGRTWSAAIRVNDDAGAADQWFPDLAVNNQGQIQAFWYDRRRHGDKPGDLRIDLYGAASTDGGVSFGSNHRINRSMSGPDDGMLPAVGFDPLINPIYMGDYNDIKAETTPGGVGLGFVSAWGDFRRLVTGESGTRPDQDVVFARQDFAPPVPPSAAGKPPDQLADTIPGDAAVIRFELGGDAAQPVDIDIYDVAGRLVTRLWGGLQTPGRHEIRWDGRNSSGERLAAGVYFARARSVGRPITCSSRVNLR